MKEYGPWKVGIECDYSAWMIYRIVSIPWESRRQLRPERFQRFKDAVAKAEELNRQERKNNGHQHCNADGLVK